VTDEPLCTPKKWELSNPLGAIAGLRNVAGIAIQSRFRTTNADENLLGTYRCAARNARR